MLLRSVFVRFYKSFNYDYLRKHDPSVKNRQPWEFCDSLWYPHVKVSIEPSITTIVGENESGKSCLLTAIEKGLTGAGIERKDFCRHSTFFSVADDKYRHPEFGFEWTDLSEAESDVVRGALKLTSTETVSRFFLFRPDPETITVYGPDPKPKTRKLPKKDAQVIAKILPRIFWLKSDVALPETVPIAYLAGPRDEVEKHVSTAMYTTAAFANVIAENEGWFSSAESIAQSASSIYTAFTSAHSKRAVSDGARAADALRLVHDLLRKVANVKEAHFRDLQNAVVSGPDAHAFATGIVTDMNHSLNRALNFPSVWVQDEDFHLRMSLQGQNLTFAVQDRTGTQYAFDERSSGLRYFLSYYIQYLAYDPGPDGDEIVVMDEPDAFLSSRGQQDLLNVFRAFASRENDDRRPVQVIYVTHSPFLIDRNRADQIRVLEKGVGEEGTRVVRDVTRNHYEPLRSAFGAFVAETAFIGNCNLMVEGTSDQVLLAGAARYLRSKDNVPKLEALDLNSITVVPTGGASQIPYLVFLTLGRGGEDQPAVIVLLDSDEEGNAAKRTLLEGVGLRGRRKPLLEERRILQLGDVCSGAVAIEDLVPLELAVAATRRYMSEYCGEGTTELTIDAVRAHHGDEPVVRPLIAIQEFLNATEEAPKIQKVGFARAVVALLSEQEEGTGVGQFASNMRELLGRLNAMQRAAMQERSDVRMSLRFQREKEKFLQDHPKSAREEQALAFIEIVDGFLDDTSESDEIRNALKELRREFSLNEDCAGWIGEYASFKEHLVRVQYAPRRAVQERPDVNGSRAVTTVLAGPGGEADQDATKGDVGQGTATVADGD